MQLMQNWHAPIYEALLKHNNNHTVSFHVPGHHNGRVLKQAAAIQPADGEGDADAATNMLQEAGRRLLPVMELDLTELSSTDDLHHPEASIHEAQQLAAQCFGAEQTFLLAGGSTAGNLALILTVCDPGDLIIVQRNVHKSVINGLTLAGASAVFLPSQVDPLTGTATIPAVEMVRIALERYPEAKALFLTNPNYYGCGVKLDEYADLAHRWNKPLLVDEAHGAHYGFHPQLPGTAMAAGADAAVQSTHKTLPALTMGAMLHIQGSLIDRGRLAQSLAMIQSSSPSFPLLASIDLARAMVAARGAALFDASVREARNFIQWLNGQSLIIRAIDNAEQAAGGIHSIHSIHGIRGIGGIGGISGASASDRHYDPLRVLLYWKQQSDGAMTGYELQSELESHGCFAEMSDPRYVVLIVGIGITGGEIERLKEAILFIHDSYRKRAACQTDIENGDGSGGANGQTILGGPSSLYEEERPTEPVSFARGRRRGMSIERVAIGEAEGEEAAEMVVPYPPGIPIVYPGERLTRATLMNIRKLASAGARFQGAQDAAFQTIAVYKPTHGR